jgi:hypothetical protein
MIIPIHIRNETQRNVQVQRMLIGMNFSIVRFLNVSVVAAFCFFGVVRPGLAEPISLVVNIHSLPSDLVVPDLSDGKPEAGKRLREKLDDYRDWELYHVVYLPTDWEPGGLYPVIVEYPGNGGFRNKLGDESTGRVEDCKLGYGISAGRGFIWVSLPFVDPTSRSHSLKWWGDAEATAKYCRTAVQHVCNKFGGDLNSVILTGFSRGAIACGYIGLRDDDTARLWRAMVIHSHYDGVRRWGYAEDDPESARRRWARFHSKPQFVTHERTIEPTRDFLAGALAENIVLLALPYENHTDTWVLKDIPERAKLRSWIKEVLK